VSTNRPTKRLSNAVRRNAASLPLIGSRLQEAKWFLDVPRYRARNPGVAIVRDYSVEGEPCTYSQRVQDRYLWDQVFQPAGVAAGTFLDVGASDPVIHNNTYMFERHLGWRGVAVEPIPSYGARWRDQRTAVLVSAAAADREGTVTLDIVVDETAHVASPDMLTSVRGASAKSANLVRESIEVPALTLTRIVSEAGLGHINLMSLDVEGFELPALRGLDFATIPVDVILVENDDPALFGDDSIREHLEGHGFIKFARIWRLDDIFVRRDFLPRIRSGSGGVDPRSPSV
jgi:FkbM family methyltransferase